jgi:hypothetical protein
MVLEHRWNTLFSIVVSISAASDRLLSEISSETDSAKAGKTLLMTVPPG